MRRRCKQEAPAQRKPWQRAPSPDAQQQQRHRIARLASVRRQFILAAMLLGVCLSSAFGAVHGSLSSAPAQHQPQPHTQDPYVIHEMHPVNADHHPEEVHFRTSLYVRSDLLAARQILLPIGSQSWWFTLAGAFFCVCLAALAAGLTVGLVSIDPFDLALIQSTEEEDCANEEEINELREEKRYADKLMPIVQKHHLLLVTLLICNACANEVLPLLLDKLVPSWVAVLLSVTFVLVFGEILPSAVFTGSSQLRLAAALTPVVWCMLTLLWLIAFPIAWLLDRVLGVEDESRMRRSELKSLIRLQGGGGGGNSSGHSLAPSPTSDAENAAYEHERGVLSVDEVNILHGALEMKDKKIEDAFVPIEQVFMLSVNDVLDIDMLAHIIHCGHSRIPVYDGEKTNIRGVLLVKRLIVLNPEDKRPVRSIACRWPLICSPELGLLSLLNLFQEGRSHLAIVCDKPSVMLAALREDRPVPADCNILGIITLEDVTELMIKEDISDETDLGVRAAMQHSATVRKRISKLKALALAEAAGNGAAALAIAARTPSFRTLRSNSSASRAAAADAAVASLRASLTNTTQRHKSLAAALDAAPHGYQAADAAADAVVAAATAATSSASASSSTPGTPQGQGDIKLDLSSLSVATTSPPTSVRRLVHTESARLLRDDTFTRAARTPLAAARLGPDLAAFVTPAPTPLAASQSSASLLAPNTTAGGGGGHAAGASSAHPPLHHRVRSVSSLLTPRQLSSAEGLTRRDHTVSNATMAALKRMQSSADVSAGSAISSSTVHEGGSNAPTRSNSLTTSTHPREDHESAGEEKALLPQRKLSHV